jgi:hypothetical protein
VAPSRAKPQTLGAVELDDHVPELRTGATPAPVGTTAENEPAADPRAQREHDHVRRSASGADLPLRHGSCVRVVVDRDRQAEVGLGALAERHAFERHVSGEDRGALPLVDG